jgi:hypothetical protein
MIIKAEGKSRKKMEKRQLCRRGEKALPEVVRNKEVRTGHAHAGAG